MNKRHKRPTLRTISEMTGLSLSTVSLALRSGAKLKPETRDKVLKTADLIGYVPDKAGVRLRTGRSNTFGLILEGLEDSVGFSRKLIHGINDEASKHNITLNVYPQYERSSSKKAIRALAESGLVDGIIITHTEPYDERVKMLQEIGFPFVTHGQTLLKQHHPYHDFDSNRFVEIGLQTLVNKGAHNILAVISNNHTHNDFSITRSFNSQILKLGLSGAIYDDMHNQDDHFAKIRELGMSFSPGENKYDGIICDSELVAISLATGLNESGFTVGEDIQIICKQTSNLLSALYPQIIGIKEAVYDSGAELARLLFAYINGQDIKDLQTLAEPKL